MRENLQDALQRARAACEAGLQEEDDAAAAERQRRGEPPFDVNSPQSSSWSLQPGRWFYYDNLPIFALQRGDGIGPSSLDDLAHTLLRMLQSG